MGIVKCFEPMKMCLLLTLLVLKSQYLLLFFPPIPIYTLSTRIQLNGYFSVHTIYVPFCVWKKMLFQLSVLTSLKLIITSGCVVLLKQYFCRLQVASHLFVVHAHDCNWLCKLQFDNNGSSEHLHINLRCTLSALQWQLMGIKQWQLLYTQMCRFIIG